jgi:hypothetical protein
MEDKKLVVEAVDFSDIEAMEEAFTPAKSGSTNVN